ncbi:hypothetical protein, partial [Pseudomonas aeruginosa]|uniref:hypothetical protein n=1 Tax=Pseudomonas aeruginosa TaxID=287 RepID=UPI002F943B5E
GLRSSRLFLAAAIAAAVMPWIQPLLDAAPIWSGPAGDDLAAFVGWHYPFPVWIAFLLAGMGVGRLDLHMVRVQVLVTVV